ncbi:hypothetical protein ACFLSS_03900 [Bacteroidota bacterium]
MKNILIIILFANLITGCKAQDTTNNKYIYSKSDSISGQIHTAERLRSFIDNRQYEEAIDLFSLKQQANIREIQKDKEIFKYWYTAWTFDSENFEKYVSRIKRKKAPFVFESGEWKIDEK